MQQVSDRVGTAQYRLKVIIFSKSIRKSTLRFRIKFSETIEKGKTLLSFLLIKFHHKFDQPVTNLIQIGKLEKMSLVH